MMRSCSRSEYREGGIARAVRDETASIVATLARSFGSLDVAGESASIAIEEALRQWRRRGVPPRPGAWLMTAARHNALDIVRRSRRYQDVLMRAVSTVPSLSEPAGVDERLPLLFGCCHPSLSSEAQLALTLRAVLGLTTEQIARATVEPSRTVGQRISRAKRKIGTAGIPLRTPEGPDRAARLDLVLAVISVMYDSARLRPGCSADANRDLADDALWLARAVASSLVEEPEAHGLCALLLFHRARESARSVNGELVRLPHQDRTLWNQRLIRAGQEALQQAAELRRPGRWQVHAAIAACHSDAMNHTSTDWPQILVLYDMLLRYDPSPIIRLNHAVALAEVSGPEMALSELEVLEKRLGSYHLWHAVQADLLRRTGREAKANNAAQRAKELTTNHAERRLIVAQLGPG